MKTLVIHPKDKTTDFLENVYKSHPEYTICRDNGITKKELKNLIEKHNRIIMLGHGTGYGLINSSRNGYLIDDRFANLLAKKETYSVWCFSKDYFKRNNITGFHTDMIISEVAEERLMLGYVPLDEKQILDNMIKFSKLLGDCIEYSPIDMKNYMLKNYVGKDDVTKFNRESICVL